MRNRILLAGIAIGAFAGALSAHGGEAEFCFEPCALKNDQPTVNFFTSPSVDTSRLDAFRRQQAAESERKAAERAAELSAPRTEINVRPTVIIEKRHRSGRYPRRGR